MKFDRRAHLSGAPGQYLVVDQYEQFGAQRAHQSNDRRKDGRGLTFQVEQCAIEGIQRDAAALPMLVQTALLNQIIADVRAGAPRTN
jgi:hypothetical protein